MFWKALTLVVNLTFLLLAITIMSILIKNDKYSEDFVGYKAQLEEMKAEMQRVNTHNLMYLEERQNRISSNQDAYQINMSRRVDVLEVRQQRLEKLRKENTRIVNTNTNTAIANEKE